MRLIKTFYLYAEVIENNVRPVGDTSSEKVGFFFDDYYRLLGENDFRRGSSFKHFSWNCWMYKYHLDNTVVHKEDWINEL